MSISDRDWKIIQQFLLRSNDAITQWGQSLYKVLIDFPSKDWGPKKVTIYFPIFYLLKSTENILFC
jgi:hypothetical protein